MADDFGVKISATGVDLSKANSNQLFLSSKYPFIKLDTQKSISFQTIFLLLNKDTPEPSGSNSITTVYSFPHGYQYVPRVWALFQVIAPAPLTNFYQAYFQDAGIIAAPVTVGAAWMYIGADKTNVTVNIVKLLGGDPTNVNGSSYKITIFTFVDDLTTN